MFLHLCNVSQVDQNKEQLLASLAARPRKNTTHRKEWGTFGWAFLFTFDETTWAQDKTSMSDSISYWCVRMCVSVLLSEVRLRKTPICYGVTQVWQENMGDNTCNSGSHIYIYITTPFECICMLIQLTQHMKLVEDNLYINVRCFRSMANKIKLIYRYSMYRYV